MTAPGSKRQSSRTGNSLPTGTKAHAGLAGQASISSRRRNQPSGVIFFDTGGLHAPRTIGQSTSSSASTPVSASARPRAIRPRRAEPSPRPYSRGISCLRQCHRCESVTRPEHTWHRRPRSRRTGTCPWVRTGCDNRSRSPRCGGHSQALREWVRGGAPGDACSWANAVAAGQNRHAFRQQ